MDFINSVDSAVLLFFQNCLRSGALDVVARALTKAGNVGAIWILTGMLCFASRKYRKIGFNIVISVALALAVNAILKGVLSRPLPFEVIEGLSPAVEEPAAWLPPAHALSSFAAALVYAVSIRKTAVPAYIVAVLISASRLYMGACYFSDVVAGAAAGTVIALIVMAFSKKFVNIPEDDGNEREDQT